MSGTKHNLQERVLVSSSSDRQNSELSEYYDLMNQLRFTPQEGRIWLGPQRVVLQHVEAIATLRKDLIENYGNDEARGVMTRMGYTSGLIDAEVAFQFRPGASHESVMAVGPALHAIEGIVSVETVDLEIDVEQGHFYGEFIWRDSAEVDAHLKHFPPSTDPVCWNLVGYACGHSTRFMGKRILYKEVECRAMGGEHCRVIGKPIREWEEVGEDIKYLAPDFQRGGFSKQYAGSDKGLPGKSKELVRPKSVSSFGSLVGVSSGFQTVCYLLQKVAATNASVIFLGETGVGKGAFAQVLHEISQRSSNPFVAINCAAIPDNLIEPELFGVEKGAYTGAIASREGRFERANNGTLFLDEIGTLTLTAQGKLLRAIQNGEIERVGGTDIKKVDVRVIAATNSDLKDSIENHEFREDLWFRLNVFPIRIPPLRERKDDIPLLMDVFFNKYTQMHNQKVTGFTERAIDALYNYHYPGNIRELENIIERAVILAPHEGSIDLSHLFSGEEEYRSTLAVLNPEGELTSARSKYEGQADEFASIFQSLVSQNIPFDKLEQMMVDEAVAQAKGNLSEAARLLGLSRARLAYRYKKNS